ncbi:ABC transporter ATP-binding protein [Bradyrhizobium ontarionense]|uniref:ABC transporter ATP-binding protein n=1 Tax=Bradyrhizobium ontarionense TaxID=2898149 RepID=A0ABY3R7G5_9BRAD|nr:ABC transporter ATP-binding protein [Bradyrhizobium sp. A19]UFZ02703.1 ABC transporter ATP-binding protein [Bradyrhizobium sp. A19]
MIELDDISKTYNAGCPNEVHSLCSVSLSIAGRAMTVLAGPSGSGKSTLVSIMGCLTRPTSGRVRLNGETVSALPQRFLTNLRRRTFGFVFQRFNLVRGITAVENVMLPGYPEGLSHARLRTRAVELLADFGLEHRVDHRVETLSGGEVQRVAIARALVNDPDIIIADEPTASLDRERVAQFLAIAADLKARGKTLIVTSHDPRITGAPIVDGVVSLADGRVAEVSP